MNEEITVYCRACKQTFIGSRNYNYTKCPLCTEEKGFYFK